MGRRHFLIAIGSLVTCAVLSGAEPKEPEFRALFNGQDLRGWVLVNTPPATWKVDDGLLVCSGKPVGEIRTDRMYQNFVLELEWRHLRPKGNAGVFVWADDITARGVPFHRGVEVQVLENAYGNSAGHTVHGDIFPIHGAKMTPINGRGGDRAFPTEERSKPSPEWNHYRIVCQDGEISLAVNGKVVTRGTGASPRKGYICLESEGGVVHYRNVKIQERPATPVDSQHVATENRGYRSLYTGLDLSGWKVSATARDHWQARDWVLAYDGAVSREHGVISTEASFGDCGFVVDVRFLKSTKSLGIGLGTAEPRTVDLDVNAPEWKPALAPSGAWNRIEGTIRDQRLNVSLNGKPVIRDRKVEGPASSITFAPDGPVELANLFVRELK